MEASANRDGSAAIFAPLHFSVSVCIFAKFSHQFYSLFRTNPTIPVAILWREILPIWILVVCFRRSHISPSFNTCTFLAKVDLSAKLWSQTDERLHEHSPFLVRDYSGTMAAFGFSIALSIISPAVKSELRVSLLSWRWSPRCRVSHGTVPGLHSHPLSTTSTALAAVRQGRPGPAACLQHHSRRIQGTPPEGLAEPQDAALLCLLIVWPFPQQCPQTHYQRHRGRETETEGLTSDSQIHDVQTFHFF